MKERIERFGKLLFTIIYTIYFLITPGFSVFAEDAPQKGDIENVAPVVSGSGEGAITVNKTVTRDESDPEGVFTVTFNIQGNQTSTTTTHPLYTVFVLDASGSMSGTPWKNAKNAAIKFSTTLTKDTVNSSGETVPTINRVALVTFSGDVLKQKGFSSSAFTSNDIGSYDNMTNYDAGLSAAYDLLNDSSIPDDAIKNVIFISDGEPNQGIYYNNGVRYLSDDGGSYLSGQGTVSEISVDGDDWNCAGSSSWFSCNDVTYTRNGTLDNLKGLLTGEKDNIYSISYNLNGWSNADNRARLAAIATNGHYINTDSDNLDDELTSIAEEISYSAAGIDATLTDEVGSDFTVYSAGNFTIVEGEASFHLDEIPEEGVSKSFKIKIDDYAATGWHETNEGFKLGYKTSAQDTEYTYIESEENPRVYWVADRSKVTANYYLNGTTEKLADSVTTESDVVDSEGNRISYSTTEKDIYGYTLVATPNNATGYYTIDDIEVNYYYTKNNGEIKNATLEKTGDDSNVAKKVNEDFNYHIEYSTTVDKFVGETTLTIVDTLPYQIDVNASNIAGGEYNANTKTITWTVTKNITESDKNITFSKDIKLVYVGINNKNLTNTVTATIKDSTLTDTHDNIVKGAHVDVKYIDIDTNEVLFENHLGEKFAGTPYETEAKTFYGYTVKNRTPENYKGVYGADDILVVYEYQRNMGEIKENSESITKEADEILNNINSSVEYKLSYQAEVINYIGTTTTIIKDTPLYRIDTTKTIFGEGASYDAETNTITWVVTSNISENNRVITFNKTLNIYYIIDEEDFDGVIVNNVSAYTTFDNAPDDFEPNVVTATASTNVLKSNVTVEYVDETGNELHASNTTNDFVGRTIDTEAIEIYGYTLKEGTPSEVTATYEEEDTTVTYVYTKNPAELKNETLTKSGDETAIVKDETFTYDLSYSATVEDYVGTIHTKVVDTLPYEIDENASDIAGGVYNSSTKTITWEFDTTIDQNNDKIEWNKTIKVIFIGIDKNKIENVVKTTTTYDDVTSNKTAKYETAVKESDVIVKYIYTDEAGKVIALADEEKTTDLVGNTIDTKAKVFYGYTLKENTPSEVTATYEENTTYVTYEYTKNPGEVTSSEVTKTGDETAIVKDETFTYTLTYKKTIENFVGTAHTKIVDTLPYEIVELESNIAGGVYDALTKTITWEFDTVLNEQNQDIEFVKTITVKFKDFNANTIKNNLHGETTYDGNTTDGDSEYETEIAKSKITVKYVDENENELHASLTTTGLVGNEESFAAEEIYGYTLKEGQEDPRVVTYEKQDRTIEFVYTKNPGEVTNSEVTKTGDETAIVKDETFTYTLTYKKTIENFVGTAHTKIVDTLPYEIVENESNIAGGVYDASTKTITWEFDTELNEQNQDIEFVKTITVKFKNFNANTIKNVMHGETTYDDNTTDGDSEYETEIAKSKITAKYIDEDENELAEALTTIGLVGNDEEFTAEVIYGWSLKEGEENPRVEAYEKEDKTIYFIYVKNDGVIEEETSKTTKQESANKTDAFEYTITYNATLDEYVGSAVTTIVDTLPYAIDLDKSDIADGVYDEDALTITWTIENEIDEDNKEITFSKDITLYYIGIVTDEVTNEVSVETSYGAKTSTTDDDAKVEINKGKVIVHYITVDGETLAEDDIIEGFVGDEYSVANKDFSLYFLSDTQGETSGEFTKDEIEVTFIYDLSGTGDEEPEEEIVPPHTGIEAIEYYSVIAIKYVIAMLIIVVSKKKLFN